MKREENSLLDTYLINKIPELIPQMNRQIRVSLGNSFSNMDCDNTKRGYHKMNKDELSKRIAELSGMPTKVTQIVLNAFCKAVSEELESGGKIQLVGFGTFSVSVSKERIGRNPRTQETILIPARNTVKFTPGSDLKRCVQQGETGR